jgi:hypothetical protein
MTLAEKCLKIWIDEPYHNVVPEKRLVTKAKWKEQNHSANKFS